MKTRNVESKGFFNKDMLTCCDRGFKLDRAKCRGGGKDDDVSPAIDHLLVSIKTNEFTLAAIGIDTT